MIPNLNVFIKRINYPILTPIKLKLSEQSESHYAKIDPEELNSISISKVSLKSKDLKSTQKLISEGKW